MFSNKKKYIFAIILLILTYFIYADYQPQGNNSIILNVKSPIENLAISNITANTAFSFGGYLDFGWIFYFEDIFGAHNIGMALSLKGMIVTQSISNPLNVELSGFYGFLNNTRFYTLESAYYHIFNANILMFKLGALFRYAQSNTNAYRIYAGGIFGLAIKIPSNTILGLDSRIFINNSMEVIWEPELLLSIYLSE